MIAAKLLYLHETKEAIKNAIEAQGVTVAPGTPFRDYALKIAEISSTAATLVTFAPPRGSDGMTVYDEITPEFWLSRLNTGGGLLNIKHEDNPWGAAAPVNSFWACLDNNPTEELSVANAANLVFEPLDAAVINHDSLSSYIVYLPFESKVFKLTVTAWYDCGTGDEAGANWTRTIPVDVVTPFALPLYTKTAALTATRLAGNDVQLTVVFEPEFVGQIDLGLYPLTVTFNSSATPNQYPPTTLEIPLANTATTVVTTYYPTDVDTRYINILSIQDINGAIVDYLDAKVTNTVYVGWGE